MSGIICSFALKHFLLSDLQIGEIDKSKHFKKWKKNKYYL